MNINENELAWVAGLVDGDGCISLKNENKNYSPYLQIVSQDISTLNKVMSIMENGYISSPTKTLYRWNTESKSCIESLKKLNPYLITKKEQSLILLKMENTINKRLNHKITKEELNIRKMFRILIDEERKNPKNLQEINEKYFWNWLGGFFDADGCISITKSNSIKNKKEYINYSLIVNIANTHKKTLDFIDSKIPHSTYSSYHNNSINELWIWRLYGKKLYNFILPLSQTSFSKKKELELGLYYLSLSYQERKKEKHRIYTQMKAYKNRLINIENKDKNDKKPIEIPQKTHEPTYKLDLEKKVLVLNKK